LGCCYTRKKINALDFLVTSLTKVTRVPSLHCCENMEEVLRSKHFVFRCGGAACVCVCVHPRPVTDLLAVTRIIDV